MPKRKNKGFSMVEIIISVAIFAVLMIPIVSGILSSMNNTTNAKTLQYRNDFTENVMEYVKQDSLENIMTQSYLKSVGAYNNSANADLYLLPDFSITPVPLTSRKLDPNLEKIEKTMIKNGINPQRYESNVYTGDDPDDPDADYFPYEEYSVLGSVKLGTKHTPYSYKIQISNRNYAVKESEGEFINPNNLKLGIVEDIDYTKVALFNGTIANYDSAVSNAFMTMKVDALGGGDEEWHNMIVKQKEEDGSNPVLFPKDKVIRHIIVSVKKSGDKYIVKCELEYRDTDARKILVSTPDKNYIKYTPFEYTYPAKDDDGNEIKEIPNIYLMYNVCLYNGFYSDDDFIIFDTSGISSDVTVRCFIVETAADYSSTLVSADSAISDKHDSLVDNSLKLYDTNRNDTTTDRSDTNIHILATSSSDVSNLYVYTNFEGIDPSKTVDASANNRKNSKVYYKENEEADALYGPTKVNDETYLALDRSAYKGLKAANVMALDKANEESRGLYDINIWLVEGSDTATMNKLKKATTDKNSSDYLQPTMTGTKGGDES